MILYVRKIEKKTKAIDTPNLNYSCCTPSVVVVHPKTKKNDTNSPLYTDTMEKIQAAKKQVHERVHSLKLYNAIKLRVYQWDDFECLYYNIEFGHVMSGDCSRVHRL